MIQSPTLSCAALALALAATAMSPAAIAQQTQVSCQNASADSTCYDTGHLDTSNAFVPAPATNQTYVPAPVHDHDGPN
jgi:hypothetical protein